LAFSDGLLYLKVHAELEERIAQKIAERLQLKAEFSQRPPESLSPQQACAFERALTRGLSIIAGGPGTGKSFTIEAIVRAHVKANASGRILVAAPTGKATSQLSERLSSLHVPHLHFATLHKALGMGLSYAPPLDYALVIVDEMSMVDAELMDRLFRGLLPNSRAVLVGDPDQLPPVETGHLFADIVSSLLKLAPDSTTRLDRLFRAETDSMRALNAQLIAGQAPGTEWFLEGSLDELLPQFATSFATLDEAHSTVRESAILSVLRRGPHGVDALNAWLAERHRGRYAPIILKRSAYGLANGESGFGWIGPAGLERCVIAGIDVDPSDVELAFCLSVHKAQGSEFPRVLTLVPPSSERFGRSALYTAATRAKRELYFWGERAIFAKALEAHMHRRSGLYHRLARLMTAGPYLGGAQERVELVGDRVDRSVSP
jgi:exodeoxyribonuclease V alpha subunit